MLILPTGVDHVSEVTVCAPDSTAVGKKIQSVIARNLYRYWFSDPDITGITWWNVVDGGAAPGEPSFSGLYDKDLNRKPVYDTLDQLINHERNEKYKALYGTLFNSATVAFYWKAFEMQPNRPRFREEYWDTEEYWNKQADPKNQPHWRRPAPDPVVDFLIGKGLRVQGHTLIWGNRKWQNPDWLLDQMMTPEESKEMGKLLVERGNLKNYKDGEKYTDAYNNMTAQQLEEKFPNYTKTIRQIFEKRIVEIAKYYGGRINSWDVVNESAIDYSKGLMVPGSGICKSTYGIMRTVSIF